jgi:hypothetical protein
VIGLGSAPIEEAMSGKRSVSTATDRFAMGTRQIATAAGHTEGS